MSGFETAMVVISKVSGNISLEFKTWHFLTVFFLHLTSDPKQECWYESSQAFTQREHTLVLALLGIRTYQNIPASCSTLHRRAVKNLLYFYWLSGPNRCNGLKSNSKEHIVLRLISLSKSMYWYIIVDYNSSF